MSDLIFFPTLSTRSKRAMKRTKGRFGRPYYYNPRGDLLKRLSEESGLSIEAVYHQLMREREALTSSQS